MTGSTHTSDRQELHNVSINEDAADAGACGQVHLPTGRTCSLPDHHPGSCNIGDQHIDHFLLEHRRPVAGATVDPPRPPRPLGRP